MHVLFFPAFVSENCTPCVPCSYSLIEMIFFYANPPHPTKKEKAKDIFLKCQKILKICTSTSVTSVLWQNTKESHSLVIFGTMQRLPSDVTVGMRALYIVS